MYKVFMDKQTIEFRSSNNLSNPFDNQLIIDISSETNIDYWVLKGVVFSDSNHVVVICNDPESTFHSVFDDFEWIEAAGGLVKKENSYLFIERFGCWDLPKGKIEIGESPELAAVREVEEECGITNPKIDHFICNTYHTYDYRGKKVLKKNWWYAMEYKGDELLTPQIEESITAVEWLVQSQFSEVKTKTYPSILEVLGYEQLI